MMARMLRIGLTAGLGLALWVRPGSAAFITYAQWSAFNPHDQGIYIAGAYDALENDPANPNRFLYNQCILGAGMKNGQLADNIVAFASSRPALQTGTVRQAMIQYLTAACGTAPIQ